VALNAENLDWALALSAWRASSSASVSGAGVRIGDVRHQLGGAVDRAQDRGCRASCPRTGEGAANCASPPPLNHIGGGGRPVAISKRPNGYEVFVWHPAHGRKLYVGVRKTLRGEGGALELQREKTEEFAKAQSQPRAKLTMRAYATEWLDVHHGPNTRRRAETTRTQNAINLRAFLEDFGDLPLDASIARRTALAWARKHPNNAKTVSAMLNDAIDDDVCKTNPFANRRQAQSRERKHISPFTEEEVDRLADIALRHWGKDGYGLTARAWVLFAAWVGCRPGETFGVTKADLRFGTGEVVIRRVKRRGGEYPTDMVVLPEIVQRAISAMPFVEPAGPIFLSVTGRRMLKGALAWHWNPVRAAFREHEKTSEQRWAQILDNQRNLDFYFCGIRALR
jgi:integrase